MKPRPSAEPAILLVDDERQTLKYFERAFARDFKVLTAASADEAEAIVDANPTSIGLVISDQRMPARSGVSLLNAIRRKHPLIIRMLTTAYSELDDAIEAVNRGEIFRYIVKPWNFDLLRQEMKTGLMVYNLQIERDLLVGEKLNVRQRMVAVERVRDLAVIAAAFPGLPTAPLAVDDYVRDGAHAASDVSAMTDASSLDMWALPQNEAAHMGAVARETSRVSDLPTLGASITTALSTTAADAAARGIVVETVQVPPAATVAVAQAVLNDAMTNVLSTLIAATPDGGKIRVSVADKMASGDAKGVTVTLTADQPGTFADPVLYRSSAPTEGPAPGRLFGAYIAARAVGGAIRVKRTAGTVLTEVSLPAQPPAGSPAVAQNWLLRLFQHFENWPG